MGCCAAALFPVGRVCASLVRSSFLLLFLVSTGVLTRTLCELSSALPRKLCVVVVGGAVILVKEDIQEVGYRQSKASSPWEKHYASNLVTSGVCASGGGDQHFVGLVAYKVSYNAQTWQGLDCSRS